MSDKQKKHDLRENIEVLDRTALLADLFVADAKKTGEQETVERCTHDGEVLRGYAHINREALESINDEHARGEEPGSE